MKDIITNGGSRIELGLHLWVFRFSKWERYGGSDLSFSMMWIGPFLIQGWYVRKGSDKQMYVGKKRFKITRHMKFTEKTQVNKMKGGIKKKMERGR